MKAKQTSKQNASFKNRLHRYVKLAVIPHKSNEYRPHLIRRYGLAMVAIVVLGLQLSANLTTTGTVLGEEADISTTALAKRTNEARSKEGLGTLRVNQKLNQAAYLKAKDMFARQYWAHDAPDGTPPWKWFDDVGYNYTIAGENLAKNFRTAEATTAAWLGSAKYRANMLTPEYSEVGFAVVSGTLDKKPTTLVVALYGSPNSSGISGATQTQVAGAVAGSTLGPMARFNIIIQSMTPALFGAVILLSFAAGVAVMAHVARYKLPKSLRESWYRHHGVLKAGGMLSVVVVMLALYGGGQI